MTSKVLAVRCVNDEIHACVRTDSPPRARLHIELRFPAPEGENTWEAAYNEALKYLDPA